MAQNERAAAIATRGIEPADDCRNLLQMIEMGTAEEYDRTPEEAARQALKCALDAARVALEVLDELDSD